jgi:xanthosine utilization system XapX-like protein
VSDLRNELLLRLGRVVLAGLIGALVFLLLVGPFAEPPSATLGLLSFLVGAAVLQILASDPL